MRKIKKDLIDSYGSILESLLDFFSFNKEFILCRKIFPMKTIFCTLSFCLLSVLTFGQVSFSVTAPASIAGGYNFTSNGDGTNWGLANLLDPMDAVMDTLKLVEDGTPGLNAQGIPFSNEGCGTLIRDH